MCLKIWDKQTERDNYILFKLIDDALIKIKRIVFLQSRNSAKKKSYLTFFSINTKPCVKLNWNWEYTEMEIRKGQPSSVKTDTTRKKEKFWMSSGFIESHLHSNTITCYVNAHVLCTVLCKKLFFLRLSLKSLAIITQYCFGLVTINKESISWQD